MGAFLKQYLWLLDLFAVLFCSFFAAKITTVYIAKSIEMTRDLKVGRVEAKSEASSFASKSPADFRVITERNIFDSSEVSVAATGDAQAADVTEQVPTGEAVKTSLGIKVWGVLVVGAGVDPRSSATVQGVGGQAAIDTYAVGTIDGFAPNTRLIRVQPDRIEFINGGRLEYALLEGEMSVSIFGPPPTTEGTPAPVTAQVPAGAAVKATGDNKFMIDQAEVDNAMKNLDQLYTEIRAVPNFAGGKVSGIKILSVKQGSIFDKLGLQRGDILERINGMELDVKRGFEIFGALKEEKKLTLDLIRQGQNITAEYEIR